MASGTSPIVYGATPVGDKVNPARMYILDLAGAQILTSSDSGTSFTAGGSVLKLDDWEAENAQIWSVPGYEGHLFVAADHTWGGGGLYLSTNGGTTTKKVSGVTSATRVTTGKPSEGKTFPAVYVMGTVGGVKGFFRSDDSLKTWQRINDNQHQFGTIHQMVGDPRVFGRVFLGTEGRGVVYGEDASVPLGVQAGHLAKSNPLVRSGNLLRSATAGIELRDPSGKLLRATTTRELDLHGLRRGVYFARSSGTSLKIGLLE
jgi:hypothetical protein